MTLRPLSVLLCLSMGLVLSACGGGSDKNGEEPPASLLVPERAWSGAVPAGAGMLEPSAFEALLAAGELTLITAEEEAAAQAAARAHQDELLQADLAYLQGQAERSDKLEELLARAAASTQLRTEPVLELGEGRQVRLLSLAQEIRQSAYAHRRARDPQALHASYAALHALLTLEQRDGLPGPESLVAADAATLRDALSQLDAALEAQPFPDGVIGETEPTETTAKVAPVAGTAMDTPACTAAPNGLSAHFEWPLKRYLTPVRDQASRGLCWAFTTVAALESRELVLNGQMRNLSEQFLANKVKAVWDREDYEDGYWAEEALEGMLVHNQTLPDESYWTYNPSMSRAGSGDDEDDYIGVCNGYSGSCSLTAHQSPRACTLYNGLTFCSGYRDITHASGNGVAANLTPQLWDGDDPLPLARLRSALDNGLSLIASLGVRVGFRQAQSAENGFVTDFRNGYFDADNDFVGGSEGGHAVLIVGFIPAEAVQAKIREGKVVVPGVTPAIGGMGVPDFLGGSFIPGGFPTGVRGYFIVKNSWGCQHDGGYLYVPDTYVAQYFTRMTVLGFGEQRSPVWQQQAFLSRALESGRAELGVPVNLFSAAPPPSGMLAELRVEATSSVAADRIDLRSTIFGTVVYGATFQSVGRRMINVRVTYPGVLGELLHAFPVDVVSTPPHLQFINLPGPVHVAETVPLSVFITDPRGLPAQGLCASTDWQVRGADLTLDADGSCSQRVRFAETGYRAVTVSAQSSGGRTGATTFQPFVQPAPENPYPRITAAGLERVAQSSGPQNCSRVQSVAQDAQIDLRANVTSCDGAVNQPPYRARTTVENPDGESLAYAWTFWIGTPENVTQRSGDATFGVNALSYGVGGSFSCGIGVTVTPPDIGREKTQPVWQGSCLVPAAGPR